MKKVLLITAVLTAVFFKTNAQVNLGVHASGIFSGGKQTEDGEEEKITIKHKLRASWKVGVTAAFPVSEHVSIAPELNLLSKGGKPSYKVEFDNNSSFKISGKASLTYLELPVNIVYQSNGFLIGAGPSISMGLGGKGNTKYTQIIGGVEFTSETKGKVKFDGDDEANDEDIHLNRFEFGANFIVGYVFKNNISVNANVNLGLSDIYPAEGSKYTSKYFGVGIGYMFSKKK
jgi:hypothetical protein